MDRGDRQARCVARVAMVNTPFLPACAGILSTGGQARPTLALSLPRPFPRELSGRRFDAAALVLSGTRLLATYPVDLFFD